MAVAVLSLLAGIAVLYGGAEAFVGGATSLARGLRISTVVVGLTVVAFASSTPELVVSLKAALTDRPDVVLGNILGSNIANIGLVLGVSALVHDLPVARRAVAGALPFVVGEFVLLYLLSRDGIIDRVDGLLLLGLFAVYLMLQLRAALRHQAAKAHEPAPPLRPVRDPALILLGLAAMVVGGHLLVEGASSIARQYGISELFIGVSIVAVGTSFPELATSFVAAWRRQADIAVGNVVGSNILNVGFVLALVVILAPQPVGPTVLRSQYPMVLGFTVALAAILLLWRNIPRYIGAALAVAYVVYLAASYRV